MWKRWLCIILLVGTVLAGAFYAMRPQPVIVEATTVKRGPLRVTVEEEGKIRIRNRFVVSAPLAGYVRRIRWNEGDSVRAGDVAAVLEPLQAEVLDTRTSEVREARLRAAEAATAVVEARLKTSEQQERAAATDSEFGHSSLGENRRWLAPVIFPRTDWHARKPRRSGQKPPGAQHSMLWQPLEQRSNWHAPKWQPRGPLC
ncbi:MAG TPA: efflux RND transporter periplasmic adaptor subunit [Bryobacteraceae bacterium]|nr:efflux RND transporter periplasmic adaptor subunit [Bryobacteraceae bacterium]